MLWLLGAALLLSLADALFLLVVAAHIGALPTIGLVILTALLGMLLVRSEGRTTLRRTQQRLARGEPPTDELIDGAMILVGAGFLITPGLLTDLTGFLLVVPVTRYPLRVALKRWLVGPYVRRKLEEGAITVEMGGAVNSDRGGGTDWFGTDFESSDDHRGDHYDLGDDAYTIDSEDDDDA